jgi:hypothetical protein
MNVWHALDFVLKSSSVDIVRMLIQLTIYFNYSLSEGERQQKKHIFQNNLWN